MKQGHHHSPESLAKMAAVNHPKNRTTHPWRRDVRTVREEKEYLNCGVIGGREVEEHDERTWAEQIMGY